MKISKFKEIGSVTIVVDGEFQSLGTLNHQKPGMLTYLESHDYLQEVLRNPDISCLITKPELVSLIIPDYKIAVAVSENPKRSFFVIHNYLARKTDFYSRNYETTIGSNTIIHPRAFVSPNNVTIGENCDIGPNVTILEDTTIEDNVVIRPGTVIGSEGYEFKTFW